jgi:hypothetical protein
MGWILWGHKKSKAGRKSSSAKKSRSVTDPKPWNPQRTLLGLKCLFVAGIVGGIAFGWQPAERYLLDYVNRQKITAVADAPVVLVNAEPWMSDLLQEQLRAKVSQSVRLPLDPTGLQRAASRLENDPWVRSLASVHRMADGRIEVTCEFRRPVALVQSDHGYHPVDREGILLPGLYREGQVQAVGLPQIVGVATAPVEPGQLWIGDDVQAGLSLVQALTQEPYMKEIAAFDVSQRDQRGRIRLSLMTHEGGQVRWGLPLGEDQPIEPGFDEKLRRLRTVHHERGTIDAGGQVVDIFGSTILVHRSNGG